LEVELSPTELDGVALLDVKRFGDARGFFMESYNRRDLATLGITADFVQDNHSRSVGPVIRGIHLQRRRSPQEKLVRCTLGAVLDVAVDLRHGSTTFGRHVAVELNQDNCRQLYMAPGFGHAFAVLGDVAEVEYKISGVYSPEDEVTVRFDDPELGIAWPLAEPIVSAKDLAGLTLSQYLEDPAY
jgi:dTDP-4-dehydrorhamnose 3,5-epimerase